VSVEGHPTEPGQEPPAALKTVTSRFFETMQIPLRLGRDFLPEDRAGAPLVAIINESFAREFFPGQNPLGKHVGIGPTPDREIIGVIGDTKYRDLRATVPNTLYLPIDQEQQPSFARTLHIRTPLSAETMSAAIREQVRVLDKDLPVARILTFSTVVDAQLVRERLIAALSGFFGAIALLLASIGLYGVVAYSVQRRTREIGIRMALGAQRRSVIRMVLRHSLTLIGVGLVIGLPLSLWLSRLVTSLLFGVTPGDPMILAGAALLLLMAALVAAYLPARRAAHVDPMTALRHE
jgi:predicted permease